MADSTHTSMNDQLAAVSIRNNRKNCQCSLINVRRREDLCWISDHPDTPLLRLFGLHACSWDAACPTRGFVVQQSVSVVPRRTPGFSVVFSFFQFLLLLRDMTDLPCFCAVFDFADAVYVCEVPNSGPISFHLHSKTLQAGLPWVKTKESSCFFTTHHTAPEHRIPALAFCNMLPA